MVQNGARPHPLPYKKTPLQYYNGVLVVAFLYLAILIVPWALLCILARLETWTQIHKYPYYTGYDARTAKFNRIYGATRFLDVLAAVAALPVVTYLLARAAVVFSQRRKRNQSLNARQLFAIADGRFIQSALHPEESTRLAVYGAALLVLACFTPPIKSLLLSTAMVPFPTDPRSTVVGFDPNPGSLMDVGLGDLIEKTKHSMINAAWNDIHTNLWRETPANYDGIYGNSPLYWNMLSYYYKTSLYGSNGGSYFVTTMENGTTTGLRIDFATRINTSVTCFADAVFPSTCGGVRPFVANYSDPTMFNARICAPGSEKSVWANTRQKQTITEELFVEVDAIEEGGTSSSFSVRCEALSTFGYFELGNYQNNGRHGPLLSETPQLPDYNTYSDKEDAIAGTGPLMLATLALFGNNTFFSTASEMTNDTAIDTYLSICKELNVPYWRIISTTSYVCDQYNLNTTRPSYYTEEDWNVYYYERVSTLLWQFIGTLGGDTAKSVLEMSTFLATEAWLTTAKDPYSFPPRYIYRDDGVQVMRPVVTLGALWAVSVLIGLQIIMILALLFYIFSIRVWTPTLDALAIARMAHQLKDDGAIARIGLRAPRKSDIKKLEKMDALVGYVEHGTELDMIRTSHPHHRYDGEDELPPPHDDDDRPPPYVENGLASVGVSRTSDRQSRESNVTTPPDSSSSAVSSPTRTPADTTPTEPASNSEPKPPYVLRVGGQGIISRRLVRRKEDWVAV